MKTEVTSRELTRLLGLTSSALADLRKREIIIPGSKRGTYRLQESIRNYVEHLRRLSAGQESEDSKHLTSESVAGQGDLAKVTAERLPGDMVLTSDLEKPETTKLRSFRSRLLGVDDSQGHFRPSVRVRLLTKRVRSFRLYVRDGRCYTVWDK